MSFDTMNAALLAIAFLVPGFILSSVLGTIYRRRSRSATDLTLQYLTFSCINHGLWSWLIVLMIHGNWFQTRLYTAAGLVFLILFASPIALGLLIGNLGRIERIQGLLSAFGFKVHQFIPTAWDFKFAQETPAWVIVRLRDGSSIYGFLGQGSFAGDEPGERDLFLEAVFVPSDNGHWQPVSNTGGILIKAGEIASIEFRRFGETQGAV